MIREWGNVVDGQQGYLDILIVNHAEHMLCAIENKVFSGEHSEQLTRYRKALERDYSTFSRHYVFLTPGGSKPLREEEQEHWTALTYAAVFDIIQQMVENNGDSADEAVRAFLRQYATTVRRNLMPETSVSQLAHRIYLEHREAVDLLVQHRPDWVAETKQWLKEASQGNGSGNWTWKIESSSDSVRQNGTGMKQLSGKRLGSPFQCPAALPVQV